METPTANRRRLGHSAGTAKNCLTVGACENKRLTMR
jgi:hypothetical protein